MIENGFENKQLQQELFSAYRRPLIKCGTMDFFQTKKNRIFHHICIVRVYYSLYSKSYRNFQVLIEIGFSELILPINARIGPKPHAIQIIILWHFSSHTLYYIVICTIFIHYG